jgi:hypothetical protein
MKSNFNKLFENIMENNTAGGVSSVFGDVSVSWGDKTKDDNRIPHLVFKKPIRRQFPELTVFATGLNKHKKTKKNKIKNAKQK